MYPNAVPVVPVALARDWAGRLKRARLAEFGGARHDILNETLHREVAAVITEFVRGVLIETPMTVPSVKREQQRPCPLGAG
jgi:hypothetical protein